MALDALRMHTGTISTASTAPTLGQIKSILSGQLPYLRAQYHVERLGIFGSYVRGEATSESDLDVLVTFSETPGLLGFIALKHFLEDTLGLSVDLGMPEAIKPRVAPRILREVEYL